MPARRDPDGDVSAFLAGDPMRHEALRRSVRNVVRSFHTWPDAESDLVQETLCRVFFNVSAGYFRGEAALLTYAQRVARYTCLEYLRKCRYVSEVDPAAMPVRSADGSPESALLQAEEHRRNLRQLASLPAECRELLRLIFVEGCGYAEVGERLGISENAVKLRVRRCRLTLRNGIPGREESLDSLPEALPHARPAEEAQK